MVTLIAFNAKNCAYELHWLVNNVQNLALQPKLDISIHSESVDLSSFKHFDYSGNCEPKD